MFDLGWMELIIIGVVALIVVGPKDLPMMFKTVGNFVGKAKKMAREFQNTMDAAASETGLREATDIVKKIDSARNPKSFLKKATLDNIENIDEVDQKSSVKKSVSKSSKKNLE